jgi:four helix bundle protein
MLMEPLQFERLTVYQKALLVVDDIIFIREHAPIGLARLIDQAERATWSMGLNTGEACNEISRRDKNKFIRYALRSAGECVAAYTIMAKYKGAHVKRCLEAADRCREVVKMLTRMLVGPKDE